jgi:hypothetical protein
MSSAGYEQKTSLLGVPFQSGESSTTCGGITHLDFDFSESQARLKLGPGEGGQSALVFPSLRAFQIGQKPFLNETAWFARALPQDKRLRNKPAAKAQILSFLCL